MKTSSVLIRSGFPFLAMVLFVPILTSSLASAFGGGNGNPFSNGTFFPNEGTFQTTVRGVNLSGVATFSTGSSTSSNSTSSGSFTVSYQGLSYTGNVDATLDSAGGTIAATMEASIARGGKGNATTTVASTWLQTGTTNSSGGQTNVITTSVSTVVVPGGQTNVPVTTITGISGGQGITNYPPGTVGYTYNLPDIQVTNTSQQMMTLPSTSVTTTNTNSSALNLPDIITPVFGFEDEMANSIYMDTLYASGSFTAKLKNSYPNQIFSGKGTMEFTAISFDLVPPALVTTTVAISVKGSRTSDTAQSFTARTVQPPSVLTTTTLQTRTN